MNLEINLNSVIAPIAKTMLQELNDVNRTLKKEVVTMYFYDDVCKVVGHKSIKYKVPEKALKNNELLLKWINERIYKAW